MKSPRDLGLILLAIWLILTGLFSILTADIPGLGLVLNILAIVAGALLLFGFAYTGRRRPRPRNIGLLLLGIWLILTGLLSLLTVGIPGLDLVLALLGLAAGVLVLFGLDRRNLARNLGMALLGIWLVVANLLLLLSASFPGSGLILALLALAAGILLLLGR